jgi:hypothetical protein
VRSYNSDTGLFELDPESLFITMQPGKSFLSSLMSFD